MPLLSYREAITWRPLARFEMILSGGAVSKVRTGLALRLAVQNVGRGWPRHTQKSPGQAVFKPTRTALPGQLLSGGQTSPIYPQRASDPFQVAVGLDKMDVACVILHRVGNKIVWASRRPCKA